LNIIFLSELAEAMETGLKRNLSSNSLKNWNGRVTI